MRITPMLQTAAVLALAAVAGLVGASGTWALWNETAPAETGTVQSANFVVEVDGADMIVNGTATTVALDNPSDALTPSSPVYASLTLSNTTDAGSDFTIGTTVGTPRVTSTNSALADALIVQSARMPASGQCSAASYPADASAGSTTAQVAKGGSQQFCLRMSLPARAPDTLVNSTAAVTVPVHVEQIR